MLGKKVEKEVEDKKELKSGRLGKFLDLRSGAFSCQRQGSLEDKFFEVDFPIQLLILNLHN